MQTFFLKKTSHTLVDPWSSLVDGDEQLDRPKGQTSMEFCFFTIEICYSKEVSKGLKVKLSELYQLSAIT